MDKHATLRAYHGSEVSKIRTGGHMIVVSPSAAESAKFRRTEAERGEEYAYRDSYLSREDLEPMAEKGQPFGDRAFAVGMTDFTMGVPESARDMLCELTETDMTLANLFFRTILEEVPEVSMVGDVLQPDMLARLRELQAFRDYEADVKAAADAAAQETVAAEAAARAAEVEAKVAEAEAKGEARVAEAEAKGEAKVAEAEAKAAVRAKAEALTQFFTMRDDAPSVYALSQIYACDDLAQVTVWLNRAYRGETSAEIFPEP